MELTTSKTITMIRMLAVDFNNLGVSLLEMGDFRDAMVMFKAASQLFTILVANGVSCSYHDQETLGKVLRDPCVRAAHTIYLLYLDEDERNEGRDMFSEGNDDEMLLLEDNESPGSHKAFICARAIRVSECLLAATYEPHNMAITCSAVLYNMGLMYHLAATESIMETSGQKALNLYGMALTLLFQDHVERESLFIARLSMFLLNNLAALNHELTHFKLSFDCMTQLTDIARALQARGVGLALRKECQCFMLNAMVLTPSMQAPAA